MSLALGPKQYYGHLHSLGLPTTLLFLDIVCHDLHGFGMLEFSIVGSRVSGDSRMFKNVSDLIVSFIASICNYAFCNVFFSFLERLSFL